MLRDCDVLVIGAGPAGLSTAINCAAEGLTVTVFERAEIGGQARYSAAIENVLGFPEGITGQELATLAQKQARKFGAKFVQDEVVALYAKGPRRSLQLASGKTVHCKAIVIACGLSPRPLTQAPTFGVYPAIDLAEVSRYAGREVAIVGGGNSAGQAAVFFSQQGAKTTILARTPLAKSMSAYLRARLDGISVQENVSIDDIRPHPESDKLCVNDGRCFDAIIGYIGAKPNHRFPVPTDDKGYILTDNALACMPGVYAIGDIRANAIRRCSTAIGDGAAVASQIWHYIHKDSH